MLFVTDVNKEIAKSVIQLLQQLIWVRVEVEPKESQKWVTNV